MRCSTQHRAEREFFVDGRYTIADIALYGYVHVADEAGSSSSASGGDAWLGRVRGQPGYVNDLEPYPANARPGTSRSIYD